MLPLLLPKVKDRNFARDKLKSNTYEKYSNVKVAEKENSKCCTLFFEICKRKNLFYYQYMNLRTTLSRLMM